MSIKLKVRYLGLFGYVFNTNMNRLRVLGIDMRAPGSSSNRVNQVSHQTVVNFNLADLAKEIEQPDFNIHYRASAPVERGQWILNNDDIVLRAGNHDLSDGPINIVSEGINNLDHIVDMRRVYQGSGLEVNKRCFTSTDPGHAGLTMRMQLGECLVQSQPGEFNQWFSMEEYYFNNHRQYVSGCLEAIKNVEADAVEIYSKQQQQSLVLRPSNGEVVVEFANTPPEGVLAARPNHDDEDIDFELVYKIAASMPAPLCIPRRNMISPAYPHPLFCGGAIFNPSDLA